MKKQEMANTSLKENRTHGTVQYRLLCTNGTEKMSGMWFRIGMRKWNGSIFKKVISRYG